MYFLIKQHILDIYNFYKIPWTESIVSKQYTVLIKNCLDNVLLLWLNRQLKEIFIKNIDDFIVLTQMSSRIKNISWNPCLNIINRFQDFLP